MVAGADAVQVLLSLPPRMARELATLEPEAARHCFATSDPPARRLGSGGGTAHLLVEAWRQTGRRQPFADWLHSSRKLMIHAGGQSRRLPAYAAVGKAFIPMPVMRWSVGQRLSQSLLDLQLPVYRQFLDRAAPRTVAMLASGDVILRCAPQLPPFPDVDILVIGLWVRPEQAQHHGVFFCPRQQPDTLAFALQKPSLDRLRSLAAQYVFLIDTGVWLLSERAVDVLLRKCGWSAARQSFRGDAPREYELYAELGLSLGRCPTRPDPALRSLTSAVLPLTQGEFYHFGTSGDLINSVSALQNLVLDQTKLGVASAKPHPDQHTQNATVRAALGPNQHRLWIENAVIPATWSLTTDHVLTGVPENNWRLALEPGVCLDFVPLDSRRFCVRAYGLADPFRGAVGEASTVWLGRPVADWFAARGLSLPEAGLPAATDIQQARLFPVIHRRELDAARLHWLFARAPAPAPALADWWRRARRLSAAELQERVDLQALYAARARRRAAVLRPLAENHARSVFDKLDLQDTARLYAASRQPLPAALPIGAGVEPLKRVHERMFRAAVLRRRRQAGWEQCEAEAFARLRELILREMELQPVAPVRRVLDDQIVWGRSPIRLDLAGGWTDTPPYCLQHGGRVLNVGVDLNGQPPIQVFARVAPAPELVIRSIDLGIEERVRTWAELARYDQVGSGFTVAKAALALAGFLPRFRQGGRERSLAQQLRAFGGGIELSMLSAVPKGSGLGTSSILAATLLGTLGELGGLGWDSYDLFRRTLALEQMLTTGGGWQDQAGGLLPGVKLIETEPGLSQKPTVRWLPGEFFGPGHANRTVLLYYTGLTRVAKAILKEIVRGMFLNAGEHLRIIEAIGANALTATDALQRHDWAGLCAAVDRSWQLNQRLDAGTNPPAVQAILSPIADYLAGAKLLGAGGGGYLLMLAKDEEAGRRVRRRLTERPANARARFVDLGLSATGFQVTRS